MLHIYRLKEAISFHLNTFLISFSGRIFNLPLKSLVSSADNFCKSLDPALSWQTQVGQMSGLIRIQTV